MKWRFEIRSAPQFGLLLVGEMLFKAFSAAVFGIDVYLVEAEVDVGPGHSGDFNVVGLPDIAVKESRERIKSALRSCGFDFPSYQAVIVNLAPADIRKEGSAFDLPMALGLLGCQGTFFGKTLGAYVFLGELSLDGSVRSVRGALSAALAAREAAVVEGIQVFGIRRRCSRRRASMPSIFATSADKWRQSARTQALERGHPISHARPHLLGVNPVLPERFGVEARHFVIFGGESDLDRFAAYFAIFYVALAAHR